jgi:effector-binding domain-containing protein
MSYECEIKEYPTQLALSIRTKTTLEDLPEVTRKAYAAISQYLGELGEQPAGAPFAAYHNMDMQDLDVELGFPVSKMLPGKGEIKPYEIPESKVVTCLHIGPHNEVEPAYDALFRWIIDNGHKATGVAYEVYLNDPGKTPSQELRTRIILPLKKD